MKFFLGLLAIIFIKPIIGIVKFLWMIIFFAVQLLFYKILDLFGNYIISWLMMPQINSALNSNRFLRLR